MDKFKEKKVIFSAEEMDRTIERLASEILERNMGSFAIIGVHTRGVYLGKRIIEKMKRDVPFGTLDINLYRDDIGEIGKFPVLKNTDIPFDLSDKIVVLVDDVLFTGRTTRAAMDAIMDFDRPKAIQLAVLVDRGNRELPIHADFVGKKVPTASTEMVRVELSEVDKIDRVILKERG